MRGAGSRLPVRQNVEERGTSGHGADRSGGQDAAAAADEVVALDGGAARVAGLSLRDGRGLRHRQSDTRLRAAFPPDQVSGAGDYGPRDAREVRVHQQLAVADPAREHFAHGAGLLCRVFRAAGADVSGARLPLPDGTGPRRIPALRPAPAADVGVAARLLSLPH